MLESASGSLPSYPGHPPAAYGGLVSLVPDLNSWPSEGARLRRAAAAWSKRYDPLLRHGVEGADGLGSLGYQTGTSEPKPDEHGRATCPEWLSSKEARGEAKQGVHAKFDPTSVRYFLVTIRVRYPSTRSHIPHRRVPYSYCTVVWFISTL